MGILRRGGLLLLGGAAIVACPAPDIPNPPLGLTINPDRASVPQGGSASATLSFSEDALSTLTWILTRFQGPESGIVGSVSGVPASGPDNIRTFTVNVGPSVPPGIYKLNVTATNTGIASEMVTFTLTVTPSSYTLTTTPPGSASVIQGGNASVTVNLNRTGGNTSDVALTATGTLPTGMTLGFTPASTSGNSSTLSIATTGASTVGAYPIVIHGNTQGLAEQLVSLTINVAEACVVISDDFETDKNWIHTQTAPAGFSQTYARQTSGGNGGGYARMTHTLAGTGTISVLHLLQTTYDPGLPGNAIRHINYSEDQIEFNPPNAGAQIGAGFVIMQNGAAVTRDIGTGGAFGNLVWQTATLPNLTQANFPGINFSSGGPLTFGFLRANSSTGSAYTTTHGIDNFRVEICR